MKILYVIISLTILLTSQISGQFNKAGRTSMQFLKIGMGARQIGVGEASIASIRDVNAVFWNPAAITGIQGTEAAFTYTNWIGDLSIYSGAVAYNLDGIATFGLSYVSLDYGDIPEALTTSTSGSIDTRTGNSFSGSDIAFSLSAAKQFTDKLSIGVNVKYVREDLYIYSSSLWAFDVGSFYDTDWKGVKIGMSAQNFSKPARWLETKEEEQQSFDLPIVYRIGVSIDLLGGEELLLGGDPSEHFLTFNADAIHSNDYAERLHLGLEYILFDMLSLRGGYKFNYEEGNLSFGAGFKYDAGFANLRVDYAYVNYDYLQSPHRISLLMSF